MALSKRARDGSGGHTAAPIVPQHERDRREARRLQIRATRHRIQSAVARKEGRSPPPPIDNQPLPVLAMERPSTSHTPPPRSHSPPLLDASAEGREEREGVLDVDGDADGAKAVAAAAAAEAIDEDDAGYKEEEEDEEEEEEEVYEVVDELNTNGVKGLQDPGYFAAISLPMYESPVTTPDAGLSPGSVPSPRILPSPRAVSSPRLVPSLAGIGPAAQQYISMGVSPHGSRDASPRVLSPGSVPSPRVIPPPRVVSTSTSDVSPHASPRAAPSLAGLEPMVQLHTAPPGRFPRDVRGGGGSPLRSPLGSPGVTATPTSPHVARRSSPRASTTSPLSSPAGTVHSPRDASSHAFTATVSTRFAATPSAFTAVDRGGEEDGELEAKMEEPMSVFRYREPSTSRHSERVHYTAGYNSGCTRAAAPQLAQQQQRVRSVDETPKQQQQRTYAIRPQRCSNFAPKKSYGALKDWCFHCGIHYDLHVWSEPPSTKTGRQESPAPQASPPPRGSPTQAYFALSPELGRPGTAVQSSNADLDGLTPSELKALLVRCVRIDYFPSLLFLKTNNMCSRSLSLSFFAHFPSARALKCAAHERARCSAKVKPQRWRKQRTAQSARRSLRSATRTRDSRCGPMRCRPRRRRS